ncbi:hypothetical protein SUDANB135_07057 (plasmid) [Streptomyces sp. SudanB135_2055]
MRCADSRATAVLPLPLNPCRTCRRPSPCPSHCRWRSTNSCVRPRSGYLGCRSPIGAVSVTMRVPLDEEAATTNWPTSKRPAATAPSRATTWPTPSTAGVSSAASPREGKGPPGEHPPPHGQPHQLPSLPRQRSVRLRLRPHLLAQPPPHPEATEPARPPRPAVRRLQHAPGHQEPGASVPSVSAKRPPTSLATLRHSPPPSARSACAPDAAVQKPPAPSFPARAAGRLTAAQTSKHPYQRLEPRPPHQLRLTPQQPPQTCPPPGQTTDEGTRPPPIPTNIPHRCLHHSSTSPWFASLELIRRNHQDVCKETSNERSDHDA